jgi:hypothetical protein
LFNERRTRRPSTPGRLFKLARSLARAAERGIGIVIFLALWEACRAWAS